MSITGIDKVKNSASTFVNVEFKGSAPAKYKSMAYLNLEFKQNLTYSNNLNLELCKFKNKVINVTQALSSPQSNKVNLGFAFINVGNNLNKSKASINSSNSIFLNVENDLSYNYLKNLDSTFTKDSKSINVTSSNSEYVITIDLDGNDLPQVLAYYPNLESKSAIELDEDEEWA